MTTAKKAPAKVQRASAIPGDPKYDWRKIYPTDVKLFKFISTDGFVICLPHYEQPSEGEVFGLMLLDKSEQELLIHIMRQHITRNAVDADEAFQATFSALQRMRDAGNIEALLTQWPEASGVSLEKS
jgi:hypothetical protein